MLLGEYSGMAVEVGIESARVILCRTAELIDEMFGDNYAKRNPEMVCAFLKSAAAVSAAGIISQANNNISESIDSFGSSLENAINHLSMPDVVNGGE